MTFCVHRAARPLRRCVGDLCFRVSALAGRAIGLTFVLSTATVLANTTPQSPTQDVDPAADPEQVADAQYKKITDETVRKYLNELSTRRRVTTLFPNRQSMLHGVQENFVNTSRGNLTFLVRDMVRVGAMPIVFGRIYDSSLAENGDFGPGWKLTVDEKIVLQDSSLSYMDAAGATHRLRISGGDILPDMAAWTPISSGSIRTGANNVSPIIVLRSRDGIVRRFKKVGGAHRLVAASHALGSVRLTYRHGLLATIRSQQGSVELTRRPDGRIVSATDDLGRTIAYAYDEAGRLVTATDLGGETWKYRYAGGDALQELAAIRDPRGIAMLEATYRDERVSSLRVLRNETRFTYDGRITKATDVLGRTTVFHQSPLGITEGIADPSGMFTQVAFDEGFRPTKITRDGVVTVRLDYDGEGRLATLVRTDGKPTAYAYNRRGLVAVTGAETARYRYSDGRLVHAEDGFGARSYGYAESGAVNAVTMGDNMVQFDTDAAGESPRYRTTGSVWSTISTTTRVA